MKQKNPPFFLQKIFIVFFIVFFTPGCEKDDPAEKAVMGTPAVSEITINTVVISSTVEYNGGAAITDKGVVWSTSLNPAIDNNEGKKSAGSDDGDFSLTLTGLSTATIYYARAYGTNSEGTAYSDHIMFTTEGELATVTTSEVADITSESAVSGGEVTDDGGLEVTARGIVWSTSENPDINSNEGIMEDGNGTGEFTSNLDDLQPLTTYYVRAYATNSKGTSYGEIVGFETAFPCGTDLVDPRDGKVYKTIQIGDQCWMKEELRYLPKVSPPLVGSETIPNYYVYGYEGATVSDAMATDNYKNYGVLYNWPAAIHACPAGWHLPGDEEWTQMVDYLIDEYDLTNEISDINGVANIIKSCHQVDSPIGGDCNTSEHPRWDSHDTHYGTDQLGFSAIPGGARNSQGFFINMGAYKYLWTSTEYSSVYPWSRIIYRHSGAVSRNRYASKILGMSVRCVSN